MAYRIIPSCLLLSALVLSAGCGRVTTLRPVAYSLQDTTSNEDTREIVTTAARRLGYAVVRVKPGLLRATHKRLTLDIDYDHAGYTVFHHKSEARLRASATHIHSKYYAYLKKLKKYVDREILFRSQLVPMITASRMIVSEARNTDLRSAIGYVLDRHRFSLVREKPGLIVAEREKKFGELTIAVRYNNKQITIEHRSSFGYYHRRQGDEDLVTEAYNKEVSGLSADIIHRLNRMKNRRPQNNEPTFFASGGKESRQVVRQSSSVQQTQNQGDQNVTVVVHNHITSGSSSDVGAQSREGSSVENTCKDLVREYGYPESATRHCSDRISARCAEALLRFAFSPNKLSHCEGVNPECAQTTFEQGNPPSALSKCR